MIVRRLLLALTTLAALVALLPSTATAAEGGRGLAPTPGHPWFGPAVDIHTDTPTAYAGRLGRTPSLYTFPIDTPLTRQGVDQLHRFAAEVAAQGAVLVVQAEPTVALDDLQGSDATALARLVAGLHDDLDLQVLLRFAPEMNGSWRPWGQQPTSYIAAFRRYADAVHALAPTVAMVWSPVYGSGYPFTKQSGADSEIDLSRTRQAGPLDTNGDGRLAIGDDPYGPYYPGDDAVDWVGLFLYRFGQSQGIERNVLPPAAEMAERLAERWGYPGNGGTPFYERFSARRGKPLLLETAALYNPSVGGASDLAMKQRWWRETFGALATHPMIGAISWLELERSEPEVADVPVDWRATEPRAIADALRADLADSPVRLGPVTTVHRAVARGDASAAPPPLPLRDAVSGPPPGRLAGQVAAVLLVVVLLATALGTRRASWRYAAPAARDLRVDLFRGALLLGTLALHLPVVGPLRDLARGATTLGGLETFVLLSGVSVGLAYPPMARLLGHIAATGRRLRRALVTLVATLAGVLGIYVLGLLPHADADAVGTLRLPSGPACDLYPGARHLFDYPPPGWIGRAFLSMQLGTWLLLPVALVVALVALSPVVAGPLLRGWWWAVLPASWAVYALGRAHDVTVLPSWSEQLAPLLVWQVLFVHGVALATYRARLTTLGRRPVGVVVLIALVVGAAAALWLGDAPRGSTPELPPLRLLVVAAAALAVVALLTTCWRPVAAALAPALVPVGRRPLVVLLAHAVLVLVVASLPGLDGPWAGTAATVVAAVALVLLARGRSGAASRAPEPVPA